MQSSSQGHSGPDGNPDTPFVLSRFRALRQAQDRPVEESSRRTDNHGSVVRPTLRQAQGLLTTNGWPGRSLAASMDSCRVRPEAIPGPTGTRTPRSSQGHSGPDGNPDTPFVLSRFRALRQAQDRPVEESSRRTDNHGSVVRPTLRQAQGLLTTNDWPGRSPAARRSPRMRAMGVTSGRLNRARPGAAARRSSGPRAVPGCPAACHRR